MSDQYLQQLTATTIASGSYLIPISDPGSGRLLKVTKDNLFNGLYVQSSGYLNMNAHSLTLSNDMTFNQALTTTSSPIFKNLMLSGITPPYIRSFSTLDFNVALNNDINFNTSGAASYIHFNSASGAGFKFSRLSTTDTGNRLMFLNVDAPKWLLGQLGDSTEDFILYNTTTSQNAWSANNTTNVVNISNLTVSGMELSVSAATSLNQNLRTTDSPIFNGIIASGDVTVAGTLTSLGTFNASGNMTFGDVSTDVITQNAGARTLNNTETITRTSVVGTAETIQIWKVSDDSTSSLTLANGTSNIGEFAPKFQGVNSTNNVALNFNGQGTTDTSTNPVILFLSQIGNGVVTTRPAIGFWNYLTPIVELTGGYNMQLKGGSTSPSLAAAAADVVSLAPVDKAAGDRRLYIQSETGSSISIGNNRLNFAAATGYLSIGSTDTITLTSTSSSFSTSVVSTGTGGIGYATGAGGAVTQATSRTTGVTLNKTTGAITLVSATGTTTWNTFTVTNSTVAATDVPRVSQKSGTDKYQIHVTAVAAGSFAITFATTGGTTTEQPVFNFVILKGVAA